MRRARPPLPVIGAEAGEPGRCPGRTGHRRFGLARRLVLHRDGSGRWPARFRRRVRCRAPRRSTCGRPRARSNSLPPARPPRADRRGPAFAPLTVTHSSLLPKAREHRLSAPCGPSVSPVPSAAAMIVVASISPTTINTLDRPRRRRCCGYRAGRRRCCATASAATDGDAQPDEHAEQRRSPTSRPARRTSCA